MGKEMEELALERNLNVEIKAELVQKEDSYYVKVKHDEGVILADLSEFINKLTRVETIR